jgi:ribosomal protein L40E
MNKVTCMECKNVYVSIGKYFEDHYVKEPDKYICLGCNAKKTT